MEELKQHIKKLTEEDCLRAIPDISYKYDKYIIINNKQYINFSSNDYLGLSTNKQLINDFFKDNEDNHEFLFSSSSSRLLTGSSSVYFKLENNLAKLFDKQSCLLFNSGYQCNLGVISTIINSNDVIFSDKLNHASIIAGAQLSKADFYRYKHLDYEHLESILKKHRSSYKKAVIISESVFSMDGDTADIKKLIELKNKYNCLLMIDEAHAFGVSGKNLCGICEQEDILDHVDIITATFGKSLASAGAFCLSNKTIINYLINKASSFIFSTSLAPVNIMWTNWLIETKFELLKTKQKQLQILTDKAHTELNLSGNSQIIPIIIGSNEKAVKISNILQSEGYFVLPIRPPTVPVNTSRLRLSLTANITFNEVQDIFRIINKEL